MADWMQILIVANVCGAIGYIGGWIGAESAHGLSKSGRLKKWLASHACWHCGRSLLFRPFRPKDKFCSDGCYVRFTRWGIRSPHLPEECEAEIQGQFSSWAAGKGKGFDG